jgi:hypothetical protein
MSITRVNSFYAATTARLSKAFTCTTERRKTNREEREAANKASLGEEIMGMRPSTLTAQESVCSSYLLLFHDQDSCETIWQPCVAQTPKSH